MASGRLLPAIRLWTGALLDLVFPPRCGGCQRQGAHLCSSCRQSFLRIGAQGCPRCGQPLERFSHVCRPLALDGILIAMAFEGAARQAIHAFKYERRRDLAGPLAEVMREAWQTRPLPVDVVAPVPLHAGRLQERGYNQAALLARELASGLGLSLDTSSLRRVRATAPQFGLAVSERRTNVAEAFAAKPGSLADRSVLLVDDVCTSGATMEACAEVVRQAGAISVYGFALARPWQSVSRQAGLAIQGWRLEVEGRN